MESDSDKLCDICNVSFTSSQHASDHYAGKPHQRKLKEAQLSSLLDNENVVKQSDESGEYFFCTLCEARCSGLENMKVHLDGRSHLRKANLSRSESHSPAIQPEDDPLFCKTCKITCTGIDNMDAHLKGSSHRKKILQLERTSSVTGNIDESLMYYDARSHFDDDSSSAENSNHGGQNDDDKDTSDDDNNFEDETFVKDLLESFGDNSKYTKTVDHKNNFNSVSEKNNDKSIFTNINPKINDFKSSERLLTKKNNLDRVQGDGNLSSVQQSLNVKTTSPNTANKSESSQNVVEENKRITRDNETMNVAGLLHNVQLSSKDGAQGKKTMPKVRLPKRQQVFHCTVCNQLMNTEKAFEDHVNGKNHMKKLLAPERDLPPNVYVDFDVTNLKIRSTPRKYQVELFNKAMKGDNICFLPTGTGKTLIGCMVVSAMLEQNPTRQVVFLVERGLLVIQQYLYIKKELGDKIFKRFCLQDLTTIQERKLLIAGLSSGSQSSGGVPLWKHDVIVVTAAYYENLLTKNLLRWKDTCLIVFDEAHHCVKSHPYNRLAHFEHQECPVEHKPKLLGLTASPAGKGTVEQTVNMLSELMHNVGEARIQIVEENEDELDIYRSNAEIEIQTVSLSLNETTFLIELKVYLLHCYLKMREMTNLLQHSDVEELKMDHKNDEDMRKFANEKLDGTLLDYIQKTIGMSGPRSESSQEQKDQAHNLIKHSHYMCVVLNILLQFGMVAAIEELQELMNLDEDTSFEFARSVALQCDYVTNFVERFIRNRAVEGTSGDCGKFSKLVDLLISPDILSLLDAENAMVLILVKERGSAFKVEELLSSQVVLRSRESSVSALVGHGTTSGTEPGMKISHQKVVLDNIRQHKYNIVVATSIAEEGIDIPECELVITLNPPSNVTALVQMRGRARKCRSKFIVVCNSNEEKRDVEDLLKREKNMMDAVKMLTVQ